MRRLAIVILIGAIAGTAAAVLLRRLHPAERPVTAAKPPDQQRTEEIFRASANAPADPDLEAAYQAVNANYFENRLPAVRLRWEPRLEEVGPLIADGFRMNGVTDGATILLNPALRDHDDDFRRVLCHEMVHIAARTEKQSHGPIFQAYLRQLLDKGAFSGAVATDAEKEERRRDLERRNSELTAAASDLAATRDAIAADAAAGRATPEDLNARTAEYNDRARRHNDAVVEFNHLIEEYNQMVAYPDGLDRERLARQNGVGEARRP